MGSGFSNDVCVAKNFNTRDDGTKTATITADGQMMIGATAAPNVRAGFLSAGSGKISVSNGPGSVTLDAVEAAFDINNLGGTPLEVASGGTGRTTFPQGSILLGELTNPLNSVSLLDNQILVGVAAATDPAPITLTSGMQSYNTATGLMTGRTITAGTNVTMTNGDGTGGNPTISAMSGTPIMAYTNVNTTPYVVNAGNYMLGVDTTAAPITVQMPNAPTTGTMYIIKDEAGTADTNAITVTTVGGAVLIDGSTSFSINVEYGSICVMFNGTKYLIY